MSIFDQWLAAAPLAEQLRGLPPGSIAGILRGEGTPPGVVSPAGAATPLQILPSTARSMNMDPRFLAQHPDAATNAGAAYLAQQYQKFGNLPDAYAAYNAGAGGAQQWINAGRPDSFPVKNGDIGQYVGRATKGQLAQNDPTLAEMDALRSDKGTPAPSAPAQSGQDDTLSEMDSLRAAPSPSEGGEPASSSTIPAPPKSFGDEMADAGRGMINTMLGATQGTTPIMGNLQGKSAYGEPIGAFETDDANQPMVSLGNGTMRDMDPTKEVALYGPNGKLMVYARSPDTDISKANAIGHVLAFGATVPDSIPGNVLKPSALQSGVQAFNQAGVRPSSIGAVTGNRFWQALHAGMKDFFPTAGPVSRADNTMLADTKSAVQNVAQRYGEPGTNLDAGSALQAGADAFRGARRSPDLPPLTPSEVSAGIAAPTRATGFTQKAQMLYDRVKSLVNPDFTTPAPNTVNSLQQSQSLFKNPEFAKLFADPTMQNWLKAFDTAGGKLGWGDLKQFRTEIGKLLAKPAIVNDQEIAALKNIYGSATKDLQSGAFAAGGDRGLLAFNRADQYYGAGLDRIKTALDGILKNADAGDSGESSFNILMRSTKAGSASENASKLTALRRSIPDEYWGDVSATILNRLGEPVASARGGEASAAAGFSPTTFMTRYGNLSDAAKDVLFSGNSSARYELDNLVGVINREAGLRKLESSSHSAGPGMIMGAVAATATKPVETILAALGSNVAGRVITNARFIRWLGRTAPLKTVPWPQKLAQLGQLAKFDASLQEPFRILSAAPADQNNGQSR